MSSPLLTMPGVVAYWQSGVGLYEDDAMVVPAVADGAPVGAWADQVGGFDLTQPTPASRGTRVTSPYKDGVGVGFIQGSPNQWLRNAAFGAHQGAIEGAWVIAWYRPRTDQVQTVIDTVGGVLNLMDQSGGPLVGFQLTNWQFATFRDNCYHGKAMVVSFDGSLPTVDRLGLRINRTQRAVNTTAGVPGSILPSLGPGVTFGADMSGTTGATATVLECAYLDHVPDAGELAIIEDYWAETFFAQGKSKVHVLGDSVSLGYPFDTGNEHNWPSRLAVLLGSAWSVQNVSIVAYMIAQMELSGGAIDQDRDEWRDRDLVILCTGTNDGFQNHSAAQAIGDMTVSVTNRHTYGYEVWVETLPFAHPGNQGVTDPTLEEYNDIFRADYNAAVRARVMGHESVMDLASQPGFEPPIDLTYYNADLTHMDSPGSLAIAEYVHSLVLLPPLPPGASTSGLGVGFGLRRGARP